jgi:predicted  nucleic acid-binding Zn-ribbon protein
MALLLMHLISDYSVLQKMASLRAESDSAVERAEQAEAKNKKLEQLLLEKEQEITSLQHKLSLAETSLDKSEQQVADLKKSQAAGQNDAVTAEGLQRKVQLLEEELDNAEKNVKETMEKLVPDLIASICLFLKKHHNFSGFVKSTSRRNTSNAKLLA